MNVLVLHGPNLSLVEQLDEVNALIRSKAGSWGLEVKILHSNHEGALIDALWAERAWVNGVVINPGPLSHYSYALRDALAFVGKPVIEVHLTDIRRRESWRRKSVIKDVCASQVLGKGVDSYVLALQRLATGDLEGKRRLVPKLVSPRLAGKVIEIAAEKAKEVQAAAMAVKKTIGQTLAGRLEKAAVAVTAPVLKPVVSKTIGRGAPVQRQRNVVSRRVVREKIAERLSGKLSASGLATWARTQYLDVQRGAPAESGQRELLEDSLQQLTLSALPASKLSEDELVELMAALDA
jgi:3-dehydroquinate dehydratase-2